MDLLLKDGLLSVEEREEGIETTEPFISLSVDRSLLDLILLILNTFRSLFDNETFEVVEASDSIEDAIDGLRCGCCDIVERLEGIGVEFDFCI